VAALLPFAGAIQDWTLAARDTSIVALLPDSFRFATYPNENHFGAFLALVLPAGLGLAGYLFLHRQWPRFGIILVCLVVITVSLMETLTRAAWMGVVFGLLAMTAVLVFAKALPGERKAWAVVAVIVGLLLTVGLAPASAVEQLRSVVALGDSPGSMAFRMSAWKDSLPIVREHALLGTGPGTFSLVFTRYRSTAAGLSLPFVDYLHNDYLQYAVEMGVFAALALVGFVFLLIYQLSRDGVSHSDRPEFPVVLGILGSIVAFAVAALYSFEFYITVNGLLFWATAAVSVRLTILDQGAHHANRS